MQSPSFASIGRYAHTTISDRILDGSYTGFSDCIDPSTLRLLPFMKEPEQIARFPQISQTLSKDQNIQDWKKGREYTATGVSQIHFGHFKASCQHEEHVELLRWMAEIPLRTGYYVMILAKKSDSLRF